MLHQNNAAFVLGNGTSRLKLKLNKLPTVATIYACNAIYREFNPHYLIAVDTKMVNEIIESQYHLTNQVWTNPNKGLISKEHINFFNPHKGWSSGPTALWLACQHGHKNIYIFGFDYHGLNGKLNNVYANTNNYRKSSDPATFFGNWLSQTEKTIREYNKINFYRVIDSGAFIPDNLSSLTNLQHVTYDEFSKKYPECI